MYIKQVTIQGFKSYKNETICEPFSPQHNVVVGRNGSGKSNFFFAIRFVLSDMFTSLSNQERSKLLHGEGVGMLVMSAYVEIVFDNSDHRIPIDRDEVTLRRAIGLKKDEYFLDSKHVSKHDVMNLLESSGFSRSNPYYIVQQGKIMQMAVMKDSERLNLLKEVAGTKVYDERRLQSVQILEDTGSKKERIEEVLQYIEERLAELEDEKDELREYQDLDRDKRAIEYTIYDKELRNTREALEKLDAERQAEALQREKSHENHEDERRVTAQLVDELSKLERELAKLRREKQAIDEERSGQLSERAKLELDVQELQAALGDEKQTENTIRSELQRIQHLIKERQAEVDSIQPKLVAVASEQEGYEKDLERARGRQEALFGKQTRTSQFSSVDERNTWIDDEIKSLRTAQKQKTRLREQLSTEVTKLARDIADHTEEMTDRDHQILERRERIETINGEYRDRKTRRDELMNERKELWGKDAGLDSRMAELQSELSKAERALFSTTSKSKSKGLEFVQQLKSEGRIQGIHGPLYDLVTCPSDYTVPVEVTAGDQLFSVVVDNDDVASQCIDRINADKLDARVTFLPLNRLRQEPHKLPKGKDFIAMVKKIECDEKFMPAVYHVFGRTLICRDMEVAAHYSREEGIDAVTLDGDKVNRKGAMTGGYIDERTSKLDMAAKVREFAQKRSVAEQHTKKLRTQLTDLDQKISQELTALKKLESEKERLRQNLDHLKSDNTRMATTHESMKRQMEEKERTQSQLVNELAHFEEQISSLTSEKSSDLDSQLADGDRAELQVLTEEISRLQPRILECSKRHAELSSKHDSIERQLKNNLRKQEQKLLQTEEDFQLEDRSAALEGKQADLDRATAALAEATSRNNELENLIGQKKSEAEEITNTLDSARAEERKLVSRGADADKRLEKILTKRKLHNQKQEEYVRKIRELGALPKGFEKHHGTDLKTLYKKLSTVNKKLKDPKYRQVNKKALDQYVTFSEQRDALVGRKDEQDNADESIQDLIQVLDNQKDEAIERTFKQVSKYFTEVFAELVPGGRAHLIMQKRAESGAQEDAEDTGDESEETVTPKKGKGKGKKKATKTPESTSTSRIENYVGVAVRVTFTGKSDETHLLQQLSGGQKSIVALALIFSIQRCDPAPFYLFDEIDAALDAAHRVAVAEMITRLKNQAQFITTTFRPEMLQNANKFYGVTFHKKVSKIECVQKAKALEFIEDEGK